MADAVATATATATAATAALLPVNASAAAARATAIAAAAIESADAHSDWSRVELFVIAALQLVLVLVAYRLDKAPNPALISESAWAMFFGVIFGVVIRFISPIQSLKNGMDPEVLFLALLPPIILEAGFNMKKRGFFSNFSTILLLAIVGTLVATFITGGILIWLGNMGLITKLTAAEAYLYGALISAVDPVATLSVFKKNGVPPLLFNLVFGESVLNDGVAIVAFTLFQRLIHEGISDVTLHDAGIVISKVFGIGLGSVGLAAIVCLTSAFLLKQADPVLRHYPSYEISIILLSAYLSYVAADLAGLSGIVALFFSGVLMSHYHLYNIAEESATALRHLLTTASFMAENFIFIYLGMSVVAYAGYFTWDWGFIFVNLVACLVGRMLNAFPMCMIANLGRDEKIPWSYMVVIWFAGLRGSIAFALALNVWTPDSTHSSVIQSTTLFTVMFTTLVFGMGTSPLLRHFNLTSNDAELEELDEYVEKVWNFGNPTSKDGATERLLSDDEDDGDYNAFRRTESPMHHHQRRSDIHNMWHRIDNVYLKPIFGGHTNVNGQGGVELHHIKSRGSNDGSHQNKKAPGSPQVSLAEIARNHDASNEVP
uniref:Sodium/hydrogen exchanger n=1 Tax=Globisporangium ultimum (strain ATCC 200006 / CBS 805.95 / DAOM BR144) TaxID=431595 RepID=K3X285_GLOUD